MTKFWLLIFDLFGCRGVKHDLGFSEAIIDYMNKYIFYFQDYIRTELGEDRLDFSKLKSMPKTELIFKSTLGLTSRVRELQYQPCGAC